MTNTTPKNTTIPTYNQYKDTGIPWLGQIPVHWKVLSNKFIFDFKNDKVGKNSNEYSLLSLTLNGIKKRDMDNPKGKFPSSFDTYQKVNKNDFVFCLFDVEETPRCVGLSDFDGMITGAYTVFKLKNDYSNKFFYYYYLNLDNQKKLKPLYTGLRNTISFDTFMSYKTAIPPKPEQTAIAHFLDRKTTQIDQAISQKQALIDRLKTYKQIIIQQAVTKGLQPNTPLKDSGVEWIGKIPAHWEVRKLKYLGKLFAGLSGKNSNDFSKIPKVNFKPFITFSAIYQNTVISDANKALEYVKIEKFEQQNKVDYNSVLFLMSSETIEDIAKSAIYKGSNNELYLNSFCKGFKTKNKNLLPQFLNFLVNSISYRIYFMIYARGFTRINLKQEYINNAPILLPPKNEQAEIVKYIEAKTTQIDRSIALQEKEIKRLQTYKTVLIDQAVTGKIKLI